MTLKQPSTLGSSLPMGNPLDSSHPLNLAATLPKGTSQAHTFTVTNTHDSGAGSLRQAILNANKDTSGVADRINFNLGTGSHTINLTSAALDITAKNLTINGTGASTLTVSGGTKLQDFKIESEANVTISGLTIANGFSTTGGGGILNNGTLTLNNSTISNNNATGGIGEGILNNGILTANGDSFTHNSAGAGGAIFNVGTATLTNDSFTGNIAGNGGALENVGTIAITNSTFTNNTNTPAGGFGGAIANAGTGKLTVTGSSFTGNSVGGGGIGAAILNNNTATLRVSNSSFTNNSAGLGAAIYNDNAHGATATALGLTFSGNTSTGSNGTLTNSNDTFGNFVATVDTLQDTNDGNFSAGHLSLRNAINGAISGETITFAPTLSGTIGLTNGELDINKSLNIQGTGAPQLTINANQKSRDFNIGTGANVSISGLSITNGSSGANNFGGGIYNQGTLSLSSDVISGNTADLGGAGIFNNEGATLTLSNSAILHNTGGNGAGLENLGNATVTNGVFQGNASPNALGGAISDSGTLLVTGVTFTQNTSQVGGGALFDNGTAAVVNSTFTNNSTNGKGGAIDLALSSGSLKVINTSFSGNQAAQTANVPGDTPDVFGPVTFE